MEMTKEQFEWHLDDLLREVGGYDYQTGLKPASDGRHHLDMSDGNYVAMITALRWSMQNISDFGK
jgi:hypothetical protein